jgi:hypothetical protein
MIPNLHPFNHLIVDKKDYYGITTIKEFVEVSFENSRKDNFYCSLNTVEEPIKGNNKYFGMALESFLQTAFNQNGAFDKRVNVLDYNALFEDEYEFGLDGMGLGYNDKLQTMRLAIQIKNSLNPSKIYTTTNSNISNMLAAMFIDKYDLGLFVTTGGGIHRKTLEYFNKNGKIIRVLNRDNLSKIYNHTDIFSLWYNNLVDN